jgi:hypothetical protein
VSTTTASQHDTGRVCAVERPTRFEATRYLGDKRTEVVYDLDADDPGTIAAVADIMAAETFTSFGPDTLDEAKNRGYRPHHSMRSEAPED